MGSVTWSETAIIEASPDDVYAWMTDFTNDDHNSEAYRRAAGADLSKPAKPSVRTIISRSGNVLKIRDEWEGSTYEQTLTLDPAMRTVRIDGAMGYEALWRAAPQGRGTTLSVEGRLGRGILGSVMKLFQAKMRKDMARDFRGHVADLQETLKTQIGDEDRRRDAWLRNEQPQTVLHAMTSLDFAERHFPSRSQRNPTGRGTAFWVDPTFFHHPWCPAVAWKRRVAPQVGENA